MLNTVWTKKEKIPPKKIKKKKYILDLDLRLLGPEWNDKWRAIQGPIPPYDKCLCYFLMVAIAANDWQN